MTRNNHLVGFSVVILVAICAAFMPWAYVHTRSGLVILTSLHVFYFPLWTATVLVVSGAVMGMLNTRNVTSLHLVVVLAPSAVVAIVCCAAFALLPLSYYSHEPMHRLGMATPGAGLFLTAVAGVGGTVMCVWSHLVSTKKSKRSHSTKAQPMVGPPDVVIGESIGEEPEIP